MLKIRVLQTETSSDIIFTEGENQFGMYDRVDICWSVHVSQNQMFEIKKECLPVYLLFDQLYENILNYHMKKDNSKNAPIEGDKIKWVSDEPYLFYDGSSFENLEEICDSVEIIKEEDLIRLKFNLATRKSIYEPAPNIKSSVRFRRSGSYYDQRFQCYINQHFYELLNFVLLNEQEVMDEEKKEKIKKLKRT